MKLNLFINFILIISIDDFYIRNQLHSSINQSENKHYGYVLNVSFTSFIE